MSSDDFKNHPKSISEIRAEKSASGKDWTPRDALIAALRDIDSGDFSPDTIVICCNDPVSQSARFYNSAPSRVHSLGTMRAVEIEFYKLDCRQ